MCAVFSHPDCHRRSSGRHAAQLRAPCLSRLHSRPQHAHDTRSPSITHRTTSTGPLRVADTMVSHVSSPMHARRLGNCDDDTRRQAHTHRPPAHEVSGQARRLFLSMCRRRPRDVSSVVHPHPASSSSSLPPIWISYTRTYTALRRDIKCRISRPRHFYKHATHRFERDATCATPKQTGGTQAYVTSGGGAASVTTAFSRAR